MESFLNETSSTDLLSQPANESTEILSMVILGLTFLLGLPGNGLVLWVAGLKMQRTVNTVWFLHLTVADFLCCLSLPFSLAHLALQGRWPYGRLLCKFIPSIIVLNMFASVFLLTAISVDRCLLVVKPIWCQNHRSVRAAFVICGCIWVMALAMCIPVFLYREIFTVDNHDMCGYNYGVDSSLDFSDFFSDQLENRSPDDSIVQLPGEMDDRSDFSSFQPNDRLWTAPTMNPLISLTDFHAQPFKRPPGDSRNLSRLSSQHTYYTSDLPGFPSEDQRTDSLNDSDPLPFPDSQLFPSTCSNCSDTHDYYNYYFSGNSSQFIYDNQVTKLKVAITMTRLVLGFLLPIVIMVVSYTLIVFQIQQGRFSKSRSKTFRVAMVVVVVFLICWTPYHIIGVLLLFVGPETPFGEALVSWDHVSIALASANSCLNPFLYALLGKDFRKKARQSMQGILAAAFSEELTHSTSCSQNKISLEKNSISTAV